MSRIYEALKNAKEIRLKNESSSGDALGVLEIWERRGSPRRELDIELTVYGRTTVDLPFYLRAKAVSGNASGGLFLLDMEVFEGHDLMLVNNQTSMEQICIVVSARNRDKQTWEVAVRFPAPNPEFWETPAADVAD